MVMEIVFVTKSWGCGTPSIHGLFHWDDPKNAGESTRFHDGQGDLGEKTRRTCGDLCLVGSHNSIQVTSYNPNEIPVGLRTYRIKIILNFIPCWTSGEQVKKHVEMSVFS